jgi:hypothetical protein
MTRTDPEKGNSVVKERVVITPELLTLHELGYDARQRTLAVTSSSYLVVG